MVDTSVLLDLVIGDPQFEPASTLCLQDRWAEGLVVCPISFIELGPAFAGDAPTTEAFLNGVGIETNAMWTIDDTIQAHRLWNDFQVRRRQVSVGSAQSPTF